MKFDRQKLLLYAVTERSLLCGRSLYRAVEEALKGGVTMVQLREKELGMEEFIAEAKELKELCHGYGAPLIINDSVEVALKSGADGVHVGATDTPVEKIRKMAGKDFIIGATAKTVEQAIAAEKAGADYLGVGAIFPSPTKKNAIRIDKNKLMEICSAVSIPAVAIGGITAENVGEIAGGGMCGIAVVSAIFGAQNIKEAAERLKELLGVIN